MYVNYVGGQDALVFDGGGFVPNADRSMAVRQPEFIEDLMVTEWQRGNEGWHCAPGPLAEPLDRLPKIYEAVMLGLRDYVNRTHFPGVLIGHWAGIASAMAEHDRKT